MSNEERIAQLEAEIKKAKSEIAISKMEIARLKAGKITTPNIEYFFEYKDGLNHSVIRIKKQDDGRRDHKQLVIRIYDKSYESHDAAVDHTKKYAKQLAKELQEIAEKME